MNTRRPPFYVYAAILDSGIVKIGQSMNPRRRLGDIKQDTRAKSVSLIFSIEVQSSEDALDLERTAIALLVIEGGRFHKGREWFKPAAAKRLPQLEERLRRIYAKWQTA